MGPQGASWVLRGRQGSLGDVKGLQHLKLVSVLRERREQGEVVRPSQAPGEVGKGGRRPGPKFFFFLNPT